MEMHQWVTGIRVAKNGKQLFTNYRAIVEEITHSEIDILTSNRFSVNSPPNSLTIGPSVGVSHINGSPSRTPSSEGKSLADSALSSAIVSDMSQYSASSAQDSNSCSRNSDHIPDQGKFHPYSLDVKFLMNFIKKIFCHKYLPIFVFNLSQFKFYNFPFPKKCRSKYCKIADNQSLLKQHYLQFFVVNCCSSRVPRSIWTFSLAGLWPTKTYSTSLERCNRYTKSSRVCWWVEVLFGTSKQPYFT